MEKSALFDLALEKLIGDMDDLEGSSAMSHSEEECPDPLGCDMHDDKHAENMTPDGGNPSVKIEIHKEGLPTLDGAKEGEVKPGAEEGLSAEEAEELRKLLKS